MSVNVYTCDICEYICLYMNINVYSTHSFDLINAISVTVGLNAAVVLAYVFDVIAAVIFVVIVVVFAVVIVVPGHGSPATVDVSLISPISCVCVCVCVCRCVCVCVCVCEKERVWSYIYDCTLLGVSLTHIL